MELVDSGCILDSDFEIESIKMNDICTEGGSRIGPDLDPRRQLANLYHRFIPVHEAVLVSLCSTDA
jgi:hypothetical protein